MSKFISTSNLNKLSKALNDRIKSLVSEEKDRAMEAEAGLQAAINGKAPASHTHDDRYFTETEVTNKLAGKSDVGHVHDDLYYTETEIDGKISTLNNAINGKAPASHNHDDRYFTETEINGKIEDINESISSNVSTLEGKISTAKAEAIAEAAKKDTALHTTISAEIDADVKVEKERAMDVENALQAAINGKADTGHNHDDRYYTESEMNTKLAGKADTSHNHDDLYYTETEIDGKITTLNNAISGKAPSTHTHDDRYFTETEINGKIEDINESISSNVSTLEGKIATAKSGAISESKSYTDTAISKLVDSAPEAMNTLNELAKAIGDHQTEYEAYVATVSANIATAKAEAIAEAAKKDTALHTTISAEIDADVKVEKERAMEAENALQNAINGKANASHGNHVPATQTADNTKFLRNDNTWATVTPANIGAAPTSHTHDDRYFTETEINGKIEDINETINSKEAALQSRISELEAALNPEVHEVSVSGGVLTLTNKKYQKCNNIVNGTEIRFPSVSKFTEIHLYFDADSNMDLSFPDCKWRVEPNIEEGGTYEVIATYNTIHWLVTIITYS